MKVKFKREDRGDNVFAGVFWKAIEVGDDYFGVLG